MKNTDSTPEQDTQQFSLNLSRFCFFFRAIAPGVLDSELFGLQTLQHIMRVTRTWDAAMSMLPKGGEKVWGNADWSPEEGYDCSKGKRLERSLDNDTDSTLGPHGKPYAHYGRLVSFGLDSAQKPSSVVREVQEECAVSILHECIEWRFWLSYVLFYFVRPAYPCMWVCRTKFSKRFALGIHLSSYTRASSPVVFTSTSRLLHVIITFSSPRSVGYKA